MTKRQQAIQKSFIEINKNIINNTSQTVLQKMQCLLDLIHKHATKLKEETIEVCLHLGTDPKKTDQNVKTSIVIPFGWHNKKKIGLFTPNTVSINNVTVGGVNLIEEIKTSKENKFDICVAHTSLEKSMNSIAKILQKTSPNKKYGTLTDNCNEVATKLANNEIKLVSNEQSMIHTTIGTSKMTAQQLVDNLAAIITVINNCKPAKLKTNMIKRMYISSTQLPKSIEISMRDISLFLNK